MPKISSFITDETLKTYYAFDSAMFKAHREENHDDAEKTARILLEYADLPLIIRARACMILGCSNAEDFLEMAEEGARIAQLGYDACDNPGDLEEQLVKDCNAVYEQAKKDYEELEDEEEGEDVTEVHEGDNNAPVTAQPTTATPSEATQFAASTEPQAQAEAEGAEVDEKKTKKIPRLITDPNKATVTGDEPPPIQRRRSQRLKELEQEQGGPEQGSADSAPPAAAAPAAPAGPSRRRRIIQTTELPTAEGLEQQREEEDDDEDAMDVE